jgi:hypothetical protein
MADGNIPLNEILAKVPQLSPTELSILAETVESLQGKAKEPVTDSLIRRDSDKPDEGLLKHK